MGRGERAAPQGLDGQGRPAEEVAAPTHASRGSHHRLAARPAGRRRRLRRRPARHRLGHGRAAERLLPVLARCADDRRLRRDFHPIRAPGADRAVRDAGAVPTRSHGAVAGGGAVVLTQWIGLYVAASLYTGFYMRWIGRHTWLAVLAVAILFPLATFFVFEKWFLVPMPKGPLEAWLGQ